LLQTLGCHTLHTTDWHYQSTELSISYSSAWATYQYPKTDGSIFYSNSTNSSELRIVYVEKTLTSKSSAENERRYILLIYTDPSGELILGFLRGVYDAVTSGALEFWNWNEDYTHDAWSKADPTLPGTAGNNSYRLWKEKFN